MSAVLEGDSTAVFSDSVQILRAIVILCKGATVLVPIGSRLLAVSRIIWLGGAFREIAVLPLSVV